MIFEKKLASFVCKFSQFDILFKSMVCNGLFISKPIPCTAETYTVNVQINKIVLLTASPTEKESESKRIIVEERYD